MYQLCTRVPRTAIYRTTFSTGNALLTDPMGWTDPSFSYEIDSWENSSSKPENTPHGRLITNSTELPLFK